MAHPDYDILLKFLHIGDSGVGKSSLLLRFTDDTFSDSFLSTIGIDFKLRTIDLDGISAKLQLWDTAGEERFRTITSSYYRGCHAILLMFDLSNAFSFQNLNLWHEQIERNSPNIPVILVGTKVDLISSRAVEAEEAKEWAEEHGMTFVETSAKDGTNVERVYLTLSQMACASLNEREEPAHLAQRQRPAGESCC